MSVDLDGRSRSVDSRKAGRLSRRGVADTLGCGEGAERRPEVKSREYWWNDISKNAGGWDEK